MDPNSNNSNRGGGNNNNNGGNSPNNPKNRQSLLLVLVCLLGALMIWNFFGGLMNGVTSKEIRYDEFETLVEEGKVEEVQLESGTLNIILKGDERVVYSTPLIGSEDKLAEFLDENGVTKLTKIPPDPTASILSTILSIMIPFVLLIVGMNLIMRKMNKGGGVMGVGKSKAKAYVQKETGVTFKDVAGEDEAKESLQEVVDFLHNPGKYTKIGAKLPKGALLVGPPGTGKTLLAKAVAGEAHVPFFSLSGSDFVEMFVGVGASRVRDLFEEAKKNAPCIIFIDEIDAIGKSRDSRFGGGNDEREQTLNQLLAEMDGFDGSKGVVILAATNRPESLDPALLRPGRFDRRIPVELPDLAGREAILRVHAKDVKCSPAIDFNAIARASAGASGAELANIINEAALLAVKDGRKSVVQKDLEEAIETVIAGYQKKGKVISNREKMIVSYHEIGHALVAALTKGSAPVHKITIVPRTSGALGYTMQVEEDERNLMTKEEAYAKIMTLTGGRCAEELIFDSITSGASNDIEQATRIARAMITRLGMSDTFGMTALETVNSQYLGGDTSLACSSETAAKIDEEVVTLIQKAHDEAKQLLKDNMGKLHELAKYLYEHETITGEEFMKILNASETRF